MFESGAPLRSALAQAARDASKWRSGYVCRRNRILGNGGRVIVV